MLDKIKILALGGLDEEGRDCYLIEINDDIFVVDCGMVMPDKTVPGIDSLLPNNEYLKQNKSRVKAYIITHGHDEEIGALKYIYRHAPAPIYCTSVARDIIISQAAIYKFRVKLDFVVVKPSDDIMIAGHRVRFFQTTHNISYSQGVVFSTNRGNIIYTSDYIIDFTVKDKEFYFDTKMIADFSEETTFLLMSESKNATLEGYCAPHHRITGKLSRFFKETDKRIFVSCFWQNAFRINEIIQLAKANGRKIYFYDKYTQLVMDIFMKGKVINLTPEDVIKEEDLLRVPSKDIVILILGYREEIYRKMERLSSRSNEDKRIILGKDDTFICCSIPTPTFEVSATRAIDSLYRTGCGVISFTRKQGPSMHARQDDLKYFLSVLKPKYYLPVRGKFTRLIANARLALDMEIGLNHTNVFILDNGVELIFDESPRPRMVPNEINKIDITPLLVDGTGISKYGDTVIEERKRLGGDGLVIIAATVSASEKKIVAGPDCQMRGFVFAKEAEPILKTLSQFFVEEIKMVLAQGSLNFEKAKENTQERGKRFIFRENGRRPLIITEVIIID